MILKRGNDIIKLLAKKNTSFTLRLFIRKATTTLNKIITNVVLKDHKIIYLQEELA